MAQTLEQVLKAAGLGGLGKINWNLRTEALYEAALKRGEVELAKHGPLVAITGQHTGRSPNDKFTVEESSSADNIWWGKVNKPFPEDQFNALKTRLCEHLRDREVFVQDCIAGADADSEIVVRVVTDSAWHALFARTMFIRPDDLARNVGATQPEFLIIHAPGFEADPARDGTNSGTFIIPNFGQRTVIIGGSRYAGEIKKSVFFLMNYLLPQRGLLSMHASANIGEGGDSAVFFGLSGTGKTTLSADPARGLIGDDEHGWGSNGIFNF
ncbi:MAG: phosphoenolpyruvate carboxykinase (ATP), partial [Gammaproteobacteria bacterium]|nr:phosphoenolpyruvate carboxykinase (ATP) [Gammaproteobacteria bacterium]